MSEYNFNMDVNTSLRLLTGGKYCDRDIVITVQEAPETGVTVAKIGNTEYKSVEKALANAKSGDTVLMVADSDESGKTLIIPDGVILDIASYTLTANRITGIFGAKLNAVTKTNAVAGAKLVLPHGNLTMPNDPFVNTEASSANAAIYIIPVWDDIQECYIFSRIRANHRALTIGDDTLYYEFGQTAENYTNKTLWIDGATDNDVAVILHIEWNATNGNKSALEYTYSDTSVAAVAKGGTVYTFTLTGLTNIGVTDLSTLKVTPLYVCDCGIIARGTTYYGA